MSHTISFPKKNFKCKDPLIDSIFIDITRLHSCTASPTVNGLSDHDAQYLILKNAFN